MIRWIASHITAGRINQLILEPWNSGKLFFAREENTLGWCFLSTACFPSPGAWTSQYLTKQKVGDCCSTWQRGLKKSNCESASARFSQFWISQGKQTEQVVCL